MSCMNPDCDAGWIIDSPLQIGANCSIYQCPECAEEDARKQAKELEDTRRQVRGSFSPGYRYS